MTIKKYTGIYLTGVQQTIYIPPRTNSEPVFPVSREAHAKKTMTFETVSWKNLFEGGKRLVLTSTFFFFLLDIVSR